MQPLTSAAGRHIYEPEHADFRESVRGFLSREALPHKEEWAASGSLDRGFWKRVAEHGFVGFEVPEQYGGLGIHDYRFNAILLEECCYLGLIPDHFMLQNDVLGPYLIEMTSDEQRDRWLPGFAAGELVAAIAMTEPGIGSDLRGIATTAKRDGDDYVVNGSKTFISSGSHADLLVTAVRTSEQKRASSSLSLLVIEGHADGLRRGRKLDKVGRGWQDTTELFFEETRVPAANLLGDEGSGLASLKLNLARERLGVAVAAVAGAEFALELTMEYAQERNAFGRPIGSFQANRFSIAQMATELRAARNYVDSCIEAENAGALTPGEAAGLKAWSTELQWKVVDRCLQLHGGYGYMDEYEISRQWRDARVQRIYGGTTELMWEIVGRELGFHDS